MSVLETIPTGRWLRSMTITRWMWASSIMRARAPTLTLGPTVTASLVMKWLTASSGSGSIICHGWQIGSTGTLPGVVCCAQRTKSVADRTPTQRPSASTTGAPVTCACDSSRAAPRSDISFGTSTSAWLISSPTVNVSNARFFGAATIGHLPLRLGQAEEERSKRYAAAGSAPTRKNHDARRYLTKDVKSVTVRRMSGFGTEVGDFGPARAESSLN